MLKKKFGLKISLFSLAMLDRFYNLILVYINCPLKTKSGSCSYIDDLGPVTEFGFKVYNFNQDENYSTV